MYVPCNGEKPQPAMLGEWRICEGVAGGKGAYSLSQTALVI